MKRTYLSNQTWAPDVVPTHHLNILWAIVWMYHNRTGHDVDDLFGEACLKYCLCRNSWKPHKGEFTTYLYHAIPNHLRDYLNKVWGYGKTVKTSTGEIVPIMFIPYEQIEHLILAAEEEGIQITFENISV